MTGRLHDTIAFVPRAAISLQHPLARAGAAMSNRVPSGMAGSEGLSTRGTVSSTHSRGERFGAKSGNDATSARALRRAVRARVPWQASSHDRGGPRVRGQRARDAFIVLVIRIKAKEKPRTHPSLRSFDTGYRGA